MKLGAAGCGRLICDSSRPLEVLTNRMSPNEVTEQLHMLCCDTFKCFIMSYFQMTSASFLSSGVTTLKALNFGPTNLITRSRSESPTFACTLHCLPLSAPLTITSAGNSIPAAANAFTTASVNLPSLRAAMAGATVSVFGSGPVRMSNSRANSFLISPSSSPS